MEASIILRQAARPHAQLTLHDMAESAVIERGITVIHSNVDLSGVETCENCGSGNFACGDCGADDYVFPLLKDAPADDVVAALQRELDLPFAEAQAIVIALGQHHRIIRKD